jgi:hypothetical protein
VLTRREQACARHKNSAMTDLYNHSQEADKRAAIENLPDLTLPSIPSQNPVCMSPATWGIPVIIVHADLALRLIVRLRGGG